MVLMVVDVVPHVLPISQEGNGHDSKNCSEIRTVTWSVIWLCKLQFTILIFFTALYCLPGLHFLNFMPSLPGLRWWRCLKCCTCYTAYNAHTACTAYTVVTAAFACNGQCLAVVGCNEQYWAGLGCFGLYEAVL